MNAGLSSQAIETLALAGESGRNDIPEPNAMTRDRQRRSTVSDAMAPPRSAEPSEHQRLTMMAQAFSDHAVIVRAVARRFVGSDGAADVTQEVFLRLWTHPECYDPERGSLRSYLCTVARGLAIDRVRQDRARQSREQRSCDGAPHQHLDPEILAVDQVATQHLWTSLGELSVAERIAIVAAFGPGKSYRQAANDLGVPEGTLKSRVRSGVRKLRVVLADYDGESTCSAVA